MWHPPPRCIDVTEEMIQCANINAQQEGVSPEFIVMDSQYLAFMEETFDIVISRNVVWTLTRPKDAYRDWHYMDLPRYLITILYKQEVGVLVCPLH
jgi:2-polyprenyl-3-methyl-5-hydroxy-6-metoxy-1,4-benzoquinol methylase